MAISELAWKENLPRETMLRGSQLALKLYD